ncbi:MAG: hypothetical protein LiPW15_821 [Parcubacteria group bacterium LiPW_15]|nr:MAG: hypothetical protein LiPW15_821 [Parcubacteria group bacterium LiPW_15]
MDSDFADSIVAPPQCSFIETTLSSERRGIGRSRIHQYLALFVRDAADDSVPIEE